MTLLTAIRVPLTLSSVSRCDRGSAPLKLRRRALWDVGSKSIAAASAYTVPDQQDRRFATEDNRTSEQ